MEGRSMVVGRLSLAGTLGGGSKFRVCFVAMRVPLGMTALLILTVGGGCRTPWRTANSEPSFDRLIEIEQQSGQHGAGRGPLASRLRPGQSPSSNNYATAASGQGLVHPAAANDLPSDRGEPNRYKTASRDADNSSDMEEMLVDVPPAQRELLRREMTAMQARNRSGEAALAEDADDANLPPRTTQKSLAEKRTTLAHQRISDKFDPEIDLAQTPDEAFERSDTPASDEFEQDGNTDTSKYQLAARKSNRQPRDASTKPKAFDEAYSRTLSDDTPAARSDSTALASERKTPTSGVVTASYSRTDLPADSANRSNQELEADSNADELDWRQHIAAAVAQLEQQTDSASPERRCTGRWSTDSCT